MSRTDRLIGIAIGLVIGVAAVLVLVLGDVGSSVDEPSLDNVQREAPR
jgi:gas vesicle protein